jgi:hypothetical protein
MNEQVRRAYASLSPGGVIAQKVPGRSVVDDVPFLRMGQDLDGADIEKSAGIVAEEAKTRGFRVYRTILWSPSQHLKLVEKVRQLNPEVEFVTVPELLELSKR